MRRTLLVIVALFSTVQVFAATATLSVVDEGEGWASIRYSADANVSAFGLRIYADSGASITDIKDYNVGECTASQKGYGIFPGTIVIDESNGVIESNGTPIAPNSDPGAAGTGLDTNTIIVEMGALYADDSCQPAQSGTLILVKVNDDCNVCVEGESIRGNVVFIDSTSMAPSVACAGIVLACYTGPDYSEWLTVGKPDSWCNPRQCHGDADGLLNTFGRGGSAWVSTEDFAILTAGYRQPYTGTESWIAADFDHALNTFGRGGSARVSTEDFAILTYYYRGAHTQEPNCLEP